MSPIERTPAPDLSRYVRRYSRARVAAGAEVIEELVDMPYGDRRYGCRDEQGHEWTFATPRRAEIT